MWGNRILPYIVIQIFFFYYFNQNEDEGLNITMTH